MKCKTCITYIICKNEFQNFIDVLNESEKRYIHSLIQDIYENLIKPKCKELGNYRLNTSDVIKIFELKV